MFFSVVFCGDRLASFGSGLKLHFLTIRESLFFGINIFTSFLASSDDLLTTYIGSPDYVGDSNQLLV